MNILVGILVVLHLLGWAVALGAIVANFKQPKVASAVSHGLYLAVGAGLVITGIAGALGTSEAALLSALLAGMP